MGKTSASGKISYPLARAKEPAVLKTGLRFLDLEKKIRYNINTAAKKYLTNAEKNAIIVKLIVKKR